jgi:hypothetical protein
MVLCVNADNYGWQLEYCVYACGRLFLALSAVGALKAFQGLRLRSMLGNVLQEHTLCCTCVAAVACRGCLCASCWTYPDAAPLRVCYGCVAASLFMGANMGACIA